jgi:hypothetical protein
MTGTQAIPKRINPPPGNKNASFILKIYSGENCDLQGKIEHVGSGQSRTFRSAGELIKLIHEKMEETGLPQASCRLRTWQ